MTFGTVAGVVGTAVGVVGGIVNGIEASNAAADQAAYNAKVEAMNQQYRLNVMAYQNADYANNVDFFKQQIAWERGEFDRTKQHVSDQIDAVNDDMLSQLSQQVAQVVQQDMVEVFGDRSTQDQARAATGTLEARLADSGVSGNTADILRGDIQRQAGNAERTYALNDDAARSQIRTEMLGTVATRNNQLASISIPTFQPLQAPKPPAPVSPVNPAAPVATPSAASIALNGISTGINLGIGAAKLFK